MEPKDKKIWIISNILIYLVYLYIMICIPYAGDDWDWGLAVGLEQLKTASLNSRYAGNLLVVLMTRSRILKAVVMSVVAWAIPYVLVCAAGGVYKNKLMRLLLCHLFVLLMPIDMWAQTYGWVSGFANYVVSVLCVVVYIKMLGELFENEEMPGVGKNKILQGILCFVFAVVSQLFLENVSIYFCIVSVIALIIAFKKTSNWKKYLALLAGHLVGLGIMFSSNIYGELFRTGETLAHLEGTGRRFVFGNDAGMIAMIGAAIENFLGLRLYSLSYTVTWMMSVILTLILIDIYMRKNMEEKVKTGLLLGIVGLLSALVIITVNDDFLPDMVMGGFYLVFFLAVGAYLIWLWKALDKWRTLLCWISSLLVLLPLAVIEEEGTRLYVTSYLLIAWVMVDLIVALWRTLSKTKKKLCLMATGIFVLGMFAYRGYVYTGIHKHTMAMQNDIRVVIEHQGDKLVLAQYPHDDFLWREHPLSEESKAYFKEFYGLPESVEIGD